MKLSFSDADHEAFYTGKLEQAKQEGHRVDSYFRSLIYLCGLCHDTRIHFNRLFEWEEWCICPESLFDGWQTGTTAKITRLAFNLWNGYGFEDPDSKNISASFLPDELFCCEVQSYFFEAIKLRYPEYVNKDKYI